MRWGQRREVKVDVRVKYLGLGFVDLGVVVVQNSPGKRGDFCGLFDTRPTFGSGLGRSI